MKVHYQHKLDRRSFLKNLHKKAIAGLAFASVFESFSKITFCEVLLGESSPKTINDILKDIYTEVTELGAYHNDNFIKREFFIDLDGNEENKEEHVVVLQNKENGKERMLIQVTYFEAKRNNSIVRMAQDTKEISCVLKAEKINVQACDYSESEMKPLLLQILEGIRNKKNLLKLLNKK